MSIENASILVDGTVATTGGTATTMLIKSSQNGQHVILDDSSEFVNNVNISFTTKEPKVNSGSPSGYTQARSTCTMKYPLLLDNGNRTVNTLSLSLAVDQETTDAEIQSMLVAAAQMLHDSDFSDFWKKQALS